MNSKLTIGFSLIGHLEHVMDNLTGCEFALSIVSDILTLIDSAVQDHLQAYSNDLSGMTLAELCGRAGINLI